MEQTVTQNVTSYTAKKLNYLESNGLSRRK